MKKLQTMLRKKQSFLQLQKNSAFFSVIVCNTTFYKVVQKLLNSTKLVLFNNQKSKVNLYS